MPNAIYVNNGTALLANGDAANADIDWSMEGVADSAGRVSAQKDWGAAPRPYIYSWTCEVQFQATPTQYATLDLYLAEAPDSNNLLVAGDEGTSDAALGDVDSVRNMKYIGSVVSENATASEVCRGAGEFVSYARYHSYVGVNNSGATINATDLNFRFDITPRYLEAQ